MKRLIAQLSILAVLICLGITSPLICAAQKPITLRLGHPMAPGNNVTVGYEKFKELVEEKSDNKIRIRIFGNAQLGSDRVTTESAQAGTLDMTSCSSPNMASFHRAFMAIDLPYITSPDKQEQLYKALDEGELGQHLRKLANSVGLEFIMFSEYGYRNFVSTKRPLSGIAALDGLKIRTTDSPVEVDVATALGMNPAPIAWGETYTALQQGTVEAEGNTYSLLEAAKHTEVLKHAMDSAHNYSMHYLLMNKKRWDSLTPNQQGVIREAAAEALAWQRKESIRLEEIAKQAFIDRGITIYTLSLEERSQLREKTASVREKYAKELPGDLLKLIQDSQE